MHPFSAHFQSGNPAFEFKGRGNVKINAVLLLIYILQKVLTCQNPFRIGDFIAYANRAI